MIKIMFVCHGNICRSPMAEVIFKDLAKKQGAADRFLVASSATSTEEIWNGIGNPVYPPAKAELERHGLSCGGKRAVKLQKSDYDKYDLFIGIEAKTILSAKNEQLHLTERKGEHAMDKHLIGKWYKEELGEYNVISTTSRRDQRRRECRKAQNEFFGTLFFAKNYESILLGTCKTMKKR